MDLPAPFGPEQREQFAALHRRDRVRRVPVIFPKRLRTALRLASVVCDMFPPMDAACRKRRSGLKSRCQPAAADNCHVRRRAAGRPAFPAAWTAPARRARCFRRIRRACAGRAPNPCVKRRAARAQEFEHAERGVGASGAQQVADQRAADGVERRGASPSSAPVRRRSRRRRARAASRRDRAASAPAARVASTCLPMRTCWNTSSSMLRAQLEPLRFLARRGALGAAAGFESDLLAAQVEAAADQAEEGDLARQRRWRCSNTRPQVAGGRAARAIAAVDERRARGSAR